MSMTTMQWPDYVVLAIFLVISLSIGVYHSLTGGRQKTVQEFIMANRHLAVIPTTISLFVSYQSAITVLGMTAEMYLYGVLLFVWVIVGFIIATVITERLFVPWMYPLKLLSVNDYFERRFESRAVRILGASTGVVVAILYMGISMYAPSAALENATGLPTNVSIPLMAVVCILYTALGGMRAVIWTDVFQFGTMFGGMLAIMIKGFYEVGGFSEVMRICGEEGRLVATNWSFDPTERHTVWGFLFGFSINWAMIYGLSQASMQRYAATESLIKARSTMLLTIPPLIVSYCLACFTGLTVFAYYSKIQCDPIVNKDVTSPNQLLSLFVMTIFSNARGFAGLFLATLYGGALSSISSSLSGAAANFWDDILKIWLDGIQESRKALINRLLVVVLGAVSTIFAFMTGFIPGPISQIVIMFSSAVYGPLLGLFLLGGVSRLCNWKGAMAGGLFGLFMSFWLGLGSLTVRAKHPPLLPTSIVGCNNVTWSGNATDALFHDYYTTTTTSSLLHESTSGSQCFCPTTAAIGSTPVSELSGLARFYSISYLWYTVFGALCTFAVGMLISLIFRDREAEARVDDRLLIPFRKCLMWRIPEEKETPQINGNGHHYTAVSNNNKNEKNEKNGFDDVISMSVVSDTRESNV